MHPFVLILRGVIAFILGLVLVLWPGATLTVLIVFFPIFLLIDGIGAIVIGRRNAKEGKWLSFVPMGILEIILAFLVYLWPDLTVVAFAFIMALWAFVIGLGEFFLSIADKDINPFARLLFAVGGIITFVLGIVVLAYPLSTSLAAIWLFGVFFLVYGVLVFVAGLWASMHHAKKSA